MAKHALLSASSANRWILCPPSARLCAGRGEQQSQSAIQGTDAHTLAAYLLEKALGKDVKDPTEDLTYYDQEMQESAESYGSYVLDQLMRAREYCPEARILVEQRVDFSRFAKGGFGTSDCLIVTEEMIHVIDFKYGAGILVSADHNPQLMCYALGALAAFEEWRDIREVRMTIFQPRKSHVVTCFMSKESLLAWADEVLSPAADLAYEGRGEFQAGDHCQFCRAKAVCRKRAEYYMDLEKAGTREAALLSPSEIAAILPKIDGLVTWSNSVKEYALQQAKAGVKYPGYKLARSAGKRRYTDEDAVARAVEKAGFDPYEKKIRGITAMTALLGRKKFDKILGGLTYRPPGKPALVPDTDADQRDYKTTAGEDSADA